jgi:hypothetical protein
MGFLDSLTPIALPPKISTKSGVDVRQMMLNAIEEQKKNVQVTEIEGKPLPKTTFKNKAGKERTREAALWYSKTPEGYATTVRYGQVPLYKMKQGDKEVPAYFPAGKTPKDLLAFYDKLADSVRKGELDERIRAARTRKPTT